MHICIFEIKVVPLRKSLSATPLINMPKQNSAILLNKYILAHRHHLFCRSYLSCGANVEVLSPKELREEIKEEVKKMNKLYK